MNPQNQNTVAQNVLTQPQFIKATPVVKYPSRYALINSQPAMLRWTNDNKVTLQVVGAAQPEFQCAPGDIKRFFYMTDHTTIGLRDGRKFMISFNKDYLRNAYGGLSGALVGDVASTKLGLVAQLVGDAVFFKKIYNIYKDDVNNDSQWWVTALSQYGVSANRLSFAKFNGLVILGLIVLIFVAGIIVAIVKSASK